MNDGGLGSDGEYAGRLLTIHLQLFQLFWAIELL